MKSIFIISVLICSILISSCGINNQEISDTEAQDIVHNFYESNYKYTATTYFVSKDDSEKIEYVYEGELISEPYQQYEVIQNPQEDSMPIRERYAFEKDGMIQMKSKIVDSEQEKWFVGEANSKLTDAYIKENLLYRFARNDVINKKKNEVFKASYETTTFSESPTKRVELPCEMVLEYYIDLSDKSVIRVVCNSKDVGKQTAIAQLVSEGMNQQEAAQLIEEQGFDYTYTNIDICDYDDDLSITDPQKE